MHFILGFGHLVMTLISFIILSYLDWQENKKIVLTTLCFIFCSHFTSTVYNFGMPFCKFMNDRDWPKYLGVSIFFGFIASILVIITFLSESENLLIFIFLGIHITTHILYLIWLFLYIFKTCFEDDILSNYSDSDSSSVKM